MRKRLFASLTAGDQVLFLDNLTGAVSSAVLASTLTSTELADRILGKSERGRVPTRALVLLTGNNLTLAGDMPRRVLKCRLDAGMENPGLRQFHGSPLLFIEQHRSELVRAGLTIIRAYQQADDRGEAGPAPEGVAGSFEEWDRLVRRPVEWLSRVLADGRYTDPLDALRAVIEDDPEREEDATLFLALYKMMGSDWWTTRDLVDALDNGTENADEESRQTSREILQGLTRKGFLSPHDVSMKLGDRRGRIAGGLRLESEVIRKGRRFRIVVLEQRNKTAESAGAREMREIYNPVSFNSPENIVVGNRKSPASPALPQIGPADPQYGAVGPSPAHTPTRAEMAKLLRCNVDPELLELL